MLCTQLTGQTQNGTEVSDVDFHVNGAPGLVNMVAKHTYLREPAKGNQETLETHMHPEH